MLAAFTLRVPPTGAPTHGLQVWDVARRTMIGGRSLADGTTKGLGYTERLAFAAAAPRLLTYGLEDRAFVWDLDAESWSRLACRLAGRDLTPEEWRTYVGTSLAYEETCE